MYFYSNKPICGRPPQFPTQKTTELRKQQQFEAQLSKEKDDHGWGNSSQSACFPGIWGDQEGAALGKSHVCLLLLPFTHPPSVHRLIRLLITNTPGYLLREKKQEKNNVWNPWKGERYIPLAWSKLEESMGWQCAYVSNDSQQ